MKRIALLGILLVGVGVGAAPALATHAWGPYHWGRTSIAPFTIQTGDNVTTPWDGYLRTSASDWSTDTSWKNPVNANVVGGSTSARKCSPVAGTVQVCGSPAPPGGV